MEALARPSQESGPHAVPILDWPGLQQRPIRNRAWAGSLLAHAVVLALLFLTPEGTLKVGPARPFRSGTVLIAPPLEMTQTAPNRNRVGKEFSLENLVPRPPLRVPAAVPPISRNAGRPVQAPTQLPQKLLPEPPSVDTASSQPPNGLNPPIGTGNLPAPPPQIQVEEKPKLAFETPGGPPPPSRPKGLGTSTIPVPGSSVQDATREAARGSRGGIVVGDMDLPASPGIAGGLTQMPAPGKVATALEMQSDPMGADFKPYLIRILAIVKRNWLAVVPESARLGRAGRVQIQFAIARDGYVPKLVIALPSGTDALDRAAVAGVSASTPFPPLPGDFKGNQVRLQFTFSYNLK
jgi:TonB family protein